VVKNTDTSPVKRFFVNIFYTLTSTPTKFLQRMIVYRNMHLEDIPAGLSLCRAAGWNQLAEDWQLFLNANSHGGLVAVDESGKVVGTVASYQYQHHFTWIGMVLVSPERQREGIGTQLLNEALHLVADDQTVKLDATPAGRAVYLNLNFTDEYRISRMHLGGRGIEILPSSSARRVEPDDLPQIFELDREVFGADRQSMLVSNLKRAPEYAYVVKTSGKVLGFCFGRPGYDFNHIGPVIASNLEVAKQLLCAALSELVGKPTVIDVPDHTPEWTEYLASLGFVFLRPLIRMFRGANVYRGLPEKQFAILGPEFG
jgi:predicted N-acetyltransferase YhbS